MKTYIIIDLNILKMRDMREMTHEQAREVKGRYPHLDLQPNVFYLIKASHKLLVDSDRDANALMDRHPKMWEDDDLVVETFLDDFGQNIMDYKLSMTP
jgi:hypothetical protein